MLNWIGWNQEQAPAKNLEMNYCVDMHGEELITFYLKKSFGFFFLLIIGSFIGLIQVQKSPGATVFVYLA